MARAFARTSDSVGQYINCTNASALSPANNLSLALWVYPTTLATGQIAHFYIARDNAVFGGASYSLLLQAYKANINRIECAFYKSNASTGLDGTTTLVANQWYHVCTTYEFITDGTSVLRLYLNGTQQASSTTAVGPLNQGSVATEIGRRTGSSSNQFPANAQIADVGIWNQTLTASEVASLSKGMSCDKVRMQGLVLYAPLVRDLIDLKGNALTNNGTTVAAHPRIYA
jgi:hypothetical protein